jgi:hypothetical protein
VGGVDLIDNLFNSKYHEHIGLPAPGISPRLGRELPESIKEGA